MSMLSWRPPAARRLTFHTYIFVGSDACNRRGNPPKCIPYSTKRMHADRSLLQTLIICPCRSESVVFVGRVSRGECEAACACLRDSRGPSVPPVPPSGGLKLIPRPVIYRALLLLTVHVYVSSRRSGSRATLK